jgi:hypothetical protein
MTAAAPATVGGLYVQLARARDDRDHALAVLRIAGASWAQLATATRTSEEAARARYRHLAPRPPGGASR